MSTREDVLLTLIQGYDNHEVALNCGMILRECIRHESLTKIILYAAQSSYFYRFFGYIELSTFDLASDAFATFKELLTRHKGVIAEFLDKQYDVFFERYTALLNSENYVTRRQSLKVFFYCSILILLNLPLCLLVAGRTFVGPLQLCHHDPIHFICRESQTHDESAS